jgi:hypothetical protein
MRRTAEKVTGSLGQSCGSKVLTREAEVSEKKHKLAEVYMGSAVNKVSEGSEDHKE